jgi:hypothetical protein
MQKIKIPIYQYHIQGNFVVIELCPNLPVGMGKIAQHEINGRIYTPHDNYKLESLLSRSGEQNF